RQRGTRASDLRALPVPLRLLQGAGLYCVRARNAGHRDAEGAQSRSRRSRRASRAPPELLRSPRAEAARMSRRLAYDDVVVATPATIPYVRYSIKAAHWFLGRALAELVKRSGLAKERIDGLCVSSFTLAPDTAVGFSEHVGLSTRWLDFIPLGGACGVVALRRAARAVQSGDAEIVVCIAGDTNHVDSFRQGTANFSRFARDAVYPVGAGGPNASFAYLTAYYMRAYGATAADFGKMCVAQRANALRFPHALFKKPLTLEEYLGARLVSDP